MDGVEIQVNVGLDGMGGDGKFLEQEVLGERHGAIVKDWERSMGVMEGLTKGLPATAHKLERAKAALEYIQEKKRKRE